MTESDPRKGLPSASMMHRLKECPRILMDAEIFERVGKWNWQVSPSGYARAHLPGSGKKGKKVYLHRLVLPPIPGLFTDHINRNKLDNRRINLRYATRSENALNSKLNAMNSSGFKGVQWDSKSQKWIARITIKGQIHNFGRFLKAEDASKAIEKYAHNIIR